MDDAHRLGLVVPSTNTVNEREFARALPPSVGMHVSRVKGGPSSVETLERMAADLDRAVSLLADALVDVVAYGCTTGSLLEGPEYARSLVDRIEETAGCPAVVTALAVVAALEHLEVREVAVSAPYPEAITARVVSFLEESGFRVVASTTLGLTEPRAVAERSPAEVAAATRGLGDASPEAVFISCTDYPTFDVIEGLESSMGVPVVTSNQATLWRALRTLEAPGPAAPLGRLFAG